LKAHYDFLEKMK
jgi:hypothetical protein